MAAACDLVRRVHRRLDALEVPDKCFEDIDVGCETSASSAAATTGAVAAAAAVGTAGHLRLVRGGVGNSGDGHHTDAGSLGGDGCATVAAPALSAARRRRVALMRTLEESLMEFAGIGLGCGPGDPLKILSTYLQLPGRTGPCAKGQLKQTPQLELEELLFELGRRALLANPSSVRGFFANQIQTFPLTPVPRVRDTAELRRIVESDCAGTGISMEEGADDGLYSSVLSSLREGAFELAIDSDAGGALCLVERVLILHFSTADGRVLVKTHEQNEYGQLAACWQPLTAALRRDELPYDGFRRAAKQMLGEDLAAGVELHHNALRCSEEPEEEEESYMLGLPVRRVNFSLESDGSNLPERGFSIQERLPNGGSRTHFWAWQEKSRWTQRCPKRRRRQGASGGASSCVSVATAASARGAGQKIRPMDPADAVSVEHCNAVLAQLYPESSRVEYRTLRADLARSVVLQIRSEDAEGQPEMPTVVRIGPLADVNSEHECLRRISEHLGENATKVLAVAAHSNTGGMKLEFSGACWLLPELAGNEQGAQLLTFKDLFTQEMLGAGPDEAGQVATSSDVVEELFCDVLGKATQAPMAPEERDGLIQKHGEHVNVASFINIEADIHAVFSSSAEDGCTRLVEQEGAHRFFSSFAAALRAAQHQSLLRFSTGLLGLTHGGLDGSSVVLDAEGAAWVMDFANTSRRHPLTDLAKFEVSVMFEYTPIKASCAELRGATREQLAHWLGLPADRAGVLAGLASNCDRRDRALAAVPEDVRQGLDPRLAQDNAERKASLFDAATVAAALAAVTSLDKPLPGSAKTGLKQPAMLKLWQTLVQIRKFVRMHSKRLEMENPVQYFLLLIHFALQVVCNDLLLEQQRYWALSYARVLAEAVLRFLGQRKLIPAPSKPKPMQGCSDAIFLYALTRTTSFSDGGAADDAVPGKADLQLQARRYSNYIKTRYSYIVDPISQERINVLEQCASLKLIQGSQRMDLMAKEVEIDREIDNEILANRLGLRKGPSVAAASTAEKEGAKSQLVSDELFGDGTRSVVLLGAAASGKTTLLQRVLLEGVAFQGSRSLQYVPLFIRAVEIGRLIEAHEWKAADDLLDLYLQHRFGTMSGRYQFLSQASASGELLLLLDGLDEVGGRSQLRSVLEAWIAERLLKRTPPMRLLVSSRHSGFKEEAFGGFKFVLLLPLRPQDQKRVAEQRLNAEQARKFVAELANPVWEDMGRNILMLSLLIHAFRLRQEDALPANRSELYRIAVRQMLGGLDAGKQAATAAEEPKLQGSSMMHFVQDLFFYVHCQGRRDFSEEDVVGLDRQVDARSPLDFMDLWNTLRNGVSEGRVPLIMCVNEDVAKSLQGNLSRYRAPHLTYQEYLAACCLVRRAREYSVCMAMETGTLLAHLDAWLHRHDPPSTWEGLWLALNTDLPGDFRAICVRLDSGEQWGSLTPADGDPEPPCSLRDWLRQREDQEATVWLVELRLTFERWLPRVWDKPWWLQVVIMVGGCLTLEELRVLGHVLLSTDDVSCAKTSLLLKVLDERGVHLSAVGPRHPLFGLKAAVRSRRSKNVLTHCLTHPSEELQLQALMEIRKFGIDPSAVMAELMDSLMSKGLPRSGRLMALRSLAGLSRMLGNDLWSKERQEFLANSSDTLVGILVPMYICNREAQAAALDIIAQLRLMEHPLLRVFHLNTLSADLAQQCPLTVRKALRRIARIGGASEAVFMQIIKLFAVQELRDVVLLTLERCAATLQFSVKERLLRLLKESVGQDYVPDLLKIMLRILPDGMLGLASELLDKGETEGLILAVDIAERLFFTMKTPESRNVLLRVADCNNVDLRHRALNILVEYGNDGSMVSQKCAAVIAQSNIRQQLRELAVAMRRHKVGPEQERHSMSLARLVQQVGSAEQKEKLVGTLAELMMDQDAGVQQFAMVLVRQLEVCDQRIFDGLMQILQRRWNPQAMQLALKCLESLYMAESACAKSFRETTLPQLLELGLKHGDDSGALTDVVTNALEMTKSTSGLADSVLGLCERLKTEGANRRIRSAALNIFFAQEGASEAERLAADAQAEGVSNNALEHGEERTYQAIQNIIQEIHPAGMSKVVARAIRSRLDVSKAGPLEAKNILERLLAWHGPCLQQLRDSIWDCARQPDDTEAECWRAALQLIAQFPEFLLTEEHMHLVAAWAGDDALSPRALLCLRILASTQSTRPLAIQKFISHLKAIAERMRCDNTEEKRTLAADFASYKKRHKEASNDESTANAERELWARRGWSFVESEHPYGNNANEVQRVTVRNPKGLSLVVFTRFSRTEEIYDVLIVGGPDFPERTAAIAAQQEEQQRQQRQEQPPQPQGVVSAETARSLSGPTGWDEPVVVNSSIVKFQFVSDESEVDWGWAALVAPLESPSRASETHAILRSSLDRYFASEATRRELEAEVDDLNNRARTLEHARIAELSTALTKASALNEQLAPVLMTLVSSCGKDAWPLLLALEQLLKAEVDESARSSRALRNHAAASKPFEVRLGLLEMLSGLYCAEDCCFELPVNSELPGVVGRVLFSSAMLENPRASMAAMRLWVRAGRKTLDAFLNAMQQLDGPGFGDSGSGAGAVFVAAQRVPGGGGVGGGSGGGVSGGGPRNSWKPMEMLRQARLESEEDLQTMLKAVEGTELRPYAFQAILYHLRWKRTQSPTWSLDSAILARLEDMMQEGNVEASFLVKELKIGCFEDQLELDSDLKVSATTSVLSWGQAAVSGHGCDVASPMSLPQLHRINVDKVACGGRCTMVLAEDGTVYLWGNPGPQLQPFPKTPMLVEGLEDVEQIAISHDESFTVQAHFAAVSKQQLYTWGYNDSAQLMHGNRTTLRAPELVAFFSDKVVIDVSVDRGSTAVLARAVPAPAASEVVAESEQEATTTNDSPVKSNASETGSVVDGCSASPVLSVFVSGNLFPASGNLGVFELEELRGKDLTQLAVCTCHGSTGCYAVERGGNAWVWGDRDANNGTLGTGQGHPNPLRSPEIIASLRGRVASIVTSGALGAAVTLDGELYTWGCQFEAGHGHPRTRSAGKGAGKGDGGVATPHNPNLPTRIRGALEGRRVVQASFGEGQGSTNAGVLTEDGALFFWGGGGETLPVLEEEFATRYALHGLAPGQRVAQLACGIRHTLILLKR